MERVIHVYNKLGAMLIESGFERLYWHTHVCSEMDFSFYEFLSFGETFVRFSGPGAEALLILFCSLEKCADNRILVTLSHEVQIRRPMKHVVLNQPTQDSD